MTKCCVVVGTGHAAAQLVPSLRAEGWAGRIVVVGEEALLPYQRPPLSKGYLNGEVTAARMLIRSQAFYEKQAVEFMLGVKVTAVDPARKCVQLDTGAALAYNYLVLATGTRARRLDRLEGANLQTAFTTCVPGRDIDQLITDLKTATTAVIVGGGYIGLETAASLRKQGLEVTVIEAVDRILQRVTAPVMSAFFARVHRDEGVKVLAGTGLASFIGSNGRISGIRTSDGQEIAADIVIVGVGVAVNDELAVAAGLAVDNGIVVNDYCETSDKHILAVGDCTNHYNRVYDRRLRLESVPNAVEQAKIAAKTVCGKRQAYNSLPWFWSDQYDVKLQIAGLSQGYDELLVRGDNNSRNFCVYYLQAGRVIAIDAVNRPRQFMQAKKLIVDGAGVPAE